MTSTALFSPAVPVEADNPALQDALSALSALGYKERDIKRIKKQLLKVDANTTQEYLSQALALIN